MISAAAVSSLRVFFTRFASRCSGVSPVAATSGIMLTPVSNPDSPSTSSGNAMTAGPAMSRKPVPCAVSACGPAAEQLRVRDDLGRGRRPTMTAFKARKTADQGDGDDHGLVEPEQEHPAEDQQQHDGDQHGVAVQEPGQVRVLEQVHRRVRRGQGDGDDPRRRHEPEQDQHERLAPPERQQLLQHGHRPLPVRALRGDPAIHRQHPQQRQRHDQQRRQRRQARRRPARRCPAGTTGSRSSPHRSGTSPSTTPAARRAPRLPPGRTGCTRFAISQRPSRPPDPEGRAGPPDALGRRSAALLMPPRKFLSRNARQPRRHTSPRRHPPCRGQIQPLQPARTQ